MIGHEAEIVERQGRGEAVVGGEAISDVERILNARWDGHKRGSGVDVVVVVVVVVAVVPLLLHHGEYIRGIGTLALIQRGPNSGLIVGVAIEADAVVTDALERQGYLGPLLLLLGSAEQSLLLRLDVHELVRAGAASSASALVSPPPPLFRGGLGSRGRNGLVGLHRRGVGGIGIVGLPFFLRGGDGIGRRGGGPARRRGFVPGGGTVATVGGAVLRGTRRRARAPPGAVADPADAAARAADAADAAPAGTLGRLRPLLVVRAVVALLLGEEVIGVGLVGQSQQTTLVVVAQVVVALDVVVDARKVRRHGRRHLVGYAHPNAALFVYIYILASSQSATLFGSW
mmetsp:Transcript_50090/g.150778  ORF Transcript_50090/g.150778 Transcript_50090/m.150778 type:complete len:343 (+) Transcript_50090:130-1158(+)